MERPEEPPGTKRKSEITYRGNAIETDNNGNVTVTFDEEYREKHRIQQKGTVVPYNHLCNHSESPPYHPLKEPPSPGQAVRVRESTLQKKVQKILDDDKKLSNEREPSENEILKILSQR